MTKHWRKTKNACVFTLTLVLLFTGLGGIYASAVGDYLAGSDSLYRTSLDDVENYLTSTTYSDYLSIYGSTEMGSDVELDLSDVNVEGSNGTYLLFDSSNAPENSDELTAGLESGENILVAGDDCTITWNVNVAKDTLYNVYVEYYTGNFDLGDHLVSKSATIERYVLINGTVPFKEARSVEFERVWSDLYSVVDANGNYILDENGNQQTFLSNSQEFLDFVLNQENNTAESHRLFVRDSNGNELKPDKALVSKWTGKTVFDSTGYFNSPLCFFFKEGSNTFSIQSIREPMAIKSIKLIAAETVPTYEQYLASHSGASDYAGDEQIIIQAEYAVSTSERTIYQLNDRSSSSSQPQDAALIRLNEIGGDKWQYVGQWITWQVDVPESGFYSIIPRSIQNYYSGMYVSRRVYINGKLPFEEANYLRFDYNQEWITEPLNDGTTEFKFYLEKGVNEIKLEVALGDMSEILSTIENSLSTINTYYRKILMITGPDADEYRDYGFDNLIPDVLKGLQQQSKLLYEVSDTLTELTGEKGSHATTLDRVALVCERMGYYPDNIASSMGTLKEYSASLGTWLTDTQNQPLDIDYICIQAPSAEAPEAEAGFFANLWYELKKFYQSFFNDYNSLGSVESEEDTSDNIQVEVWTASSRDQAQIIRTLADDDFTPNYAGISVNINLVAGGTLLPATLAGTGPDIYLGASQGDPVNYAIRSAVLSLNTQTGNPEVGYNFNDLENSVWNSKDESGNYKYPAYHALIENGAIKSFDEVTEWFADEALVPVTIYGETYAIPWTMSFSMMFYRKDIFVELGIEVPNTWDDFYDIIYALQSNSLDIGFPTGTGGSMFMMYQQGDELYDVGNYDYYLDLFRRYHYDGDDYDSLSAEQIAEIDKELDELGYTYKDADGNLYTKTDGMSINLDSDIALATFQDVCRLFTDYSFPVSYNFANRFRSGEMPLAVIDYTSYNTLIVFAPEINGLWEFTPLPGTADELTQEVNNVTIGAISTIMMMRSVNEETALAAWSFMQWFMSADIQSSYGNEMVALLGPSAKQPTANIYALQDMAWSTDEYNNLFAQFNAVACTPEFPGSYIIGRYTGFAFLDVYNNGANPVDELQSYINDINVELTRKREEFGLPTTDFIKDMEAAVEEKYPDWEKGAGN